MIKIKNYDYFLFLRKTNYVCVYVRLSIAIEKTKILFIQSCSSFMSKIQLRFLAQQILFSIFYTVGYRNILYGNRTRIGRTLI